MNNRLSWKQYALALAETAKLRSEDLFRQVGAVGLNHDNRVIGVAYNGLAAGKRVPDEFWLDADKRRPFMIHAEANLLSLFTRDECKLLACTLSPCKSCAQLIAAWGIKEVVYKEVYDKDGEGLDILKFYGIPASQL